MIHTITFVTNVSLCHPVNSICKLLSEENPLPHHGTIRTNEICLVVVAVGADLQCTSDRSSRHHPFSSVPVAHQLLFPGHDTQPSKCSEVHVSQQYVIQCHSQPLEVEFLVCSVRTFQDSVDYNLLFQYNEDF